MDIEIFKPLLVKLAVMLDLRVDLGEPERVDGVCQICRQAHEYGHLDNVADLELVLDMNWHPAAFVVERALHTVLDLGKVLRWNAYLRGLVKRVHNCYLCGIELNAILFSDVFGIKAFERHLFERHFDILYLYVYHAEIVLTGNCADTWSCAATIGLARVQSTVLDMLEHVLDPWTRRRICCFKCGSRLRSEWACVGTNKHSIMRIQGRGSFFMARAVETADGQTLVCVRCSRIRSQSAERAIIDVRDSRFYRMFAAQQLARAQELGFVRNYSIAYEHSIMFSVQIKYHKDRALVEAGLDPLPHVVGRMRIARQCPMFLMRNMVGQVIVVLQTAWKDSEYDTVELYRNSAYNVATLPDLYQRIYAFYSQHPAIVQMLGRLNGKVSQTFKTEVAERLMERWQMKNERDVEKQLIWNWYLGSDYDLFILFFLRTDEVVEDVWSRISRWESFRSNKMPMDVFLDDFYATQHMEKLLFANVWAHGELVMRNSANLACRDNLGYNDAMVMKLNGFTPIICRNVNYVTFLFFQKLVKRLRNDNKYLVDGATCTATVPALLGDLTGTMSQRRYIKEVSIKPIFMVASARMAWHEIINAIREKGMPDFMLTFAYDDYGLYTRSLFTSKPRYGAEDKASVEFEHVRVFTERLRYLTENCLSRGNTVVVGGIDSKVVGGSPVKFSHVITKYELQARGQIHAHLLVWIARHDDTDRYNYQDLYMNEGLCAEFYAREPKPLSDEQKERLLDSLVCTSVNHPDPDRQADLKRYQIHTHRPECRGDDNPVCLLGFPARVCAATVMEHNNAVLRRKAGDENVVPFIPYMQEVMRCHTDARLCNSAAVSFYVGKYVAGVSKVNPFEIYLQHADPFMVHEERKREVKEWKDRHFYYSLGYRDTIEHIELYGIAYTEVCMYLQDVRTFNSSSPSTKVGELNYNVLNVGKLQKAAPDADIKTCLGENSLDQYYTRGEAHRNVCLYEFVKCYELRKDNRRRGFNTYVRMNDHRKFKTIVIRAEQLDSRSLRARILFLRLFWPHTYTQWSELVTDEDKLNKIEALSVEKHWYWDFCYKVLFKPVDGFSDLINKVVDDNTVLQDRSSALAQDLLRYMSRTAPGSERQICDWLRDNALKVVKGRYGESEIPEQLLGLDFALAWVSNSITTRLAEFDEYRESSLLAKCEYVTRLSWFIKDKLFMENAERFAEIANYEVRNFNIDLVAFSRIYCLLHGLCVTDDQRGMFATVCHSVLVRAGVCAGTSNWAIVNGSAGCGKSHVLSFVWILFALFGIKIAILTISAKAAAVLLKFVRQNYNGLVAAHRHVFAQQREPQIEGISTIHGFFGLSFSFQANLMTDQRRALCDNYRVVIFDEFSMINRNIFMSILRIFAAYLQVPPTSVDVQCHFLVWLIGDMFQLAPVSGIPVHMSEEVMAYLPNRFLMDQVVRQNDPQLLQTLALVRNPFAYARDRNLNKAEVSQLIVDKLDVLRRNSQLGKPLKLYFFNHRIDAVNNKYIREQCAQPTYRLEMNCNVNLNLLRYLRDGLTTPTSEFHDFEVPVAVGEKYMFTSNADPGAYILNGVIFTIDSVQLNETQRIVSFDYVTEIDENVVLRYNPKLCRKKFVREGEYLCVSFNYWPLRLFRAISICKSQGLTIDGGLEVEFTAENLQLKQCQTISMTLSRVKRTEDLAIARMDASYVKRFVSSQFGHTQRLTALISRFFRFDMHDIDYLRTALNHVPAQEQENPPIYE